MGEPLKLPFHNHLETCPVVNDEIRKMYKNNLKQLEAKGRKL